MVRFGEFWTSSAGTARRCTGQSSSDLTWPTGGLRGRCAEGRVLVCLLRAVSLATQCQHAYRCSAARRSFGGAGGGLIARYFPSRGRTADPARLAWRQERRGSACPWRLLPHCAGGVLAEMERVAAELLSRPDEARKLATAGRARPVAGNDVRPEPPHNTPRSTPASSPQ